MKKNDLRDRMRDTLIGNEIERIHEMNLWGLAAHMFIEGYPDEILVMWACPDENEPAVYAVDRVNKFIDSLAEKAKNIDEFEKLVNENRDKLYDITTRKEEVKRIRELKKKRAKHE